MAKHNERLSRLPLWLALGFLSLFVIVPLAVLIYETFASPDGFTLDAWRALADDENAKAQLLASLRLGL
ncbi:MAG: ABC-type spermidine/putrescine transport system permease subunit II, partial [Neolewinella sp.]